MYKFLVYGFILHLLSCKQKQAPNYETLFKERALCICITKGLDSSGSNYEIQKLKFYDPFSTVFYDSIIYESLKPVFRKMYIDSAQKIDQVTEAAQGKDVFKICMEYYNSKAIEKLAKERSGLIKKIKNIQIEISEKFKAY